MSEKRGTTAGANSRPLELKSAAPRRLDFETANAEEEEEGQRTPRQPQAEAPPRQTQGLPPGTPHRDEGVSPGQSVTDAITNAAKSKEADRIRVNSWPEPAGFRLWRMTLLDEVAAASAKPQRALEWTLELQNSGATLESLRTTGDDVATLDAKLASALTHTAPSDFQRPSQAKKAHAMKMGKMLAGRQILFMIDQHFIMSEMGNSVYEAEHLFSIKLKGATPKSSSPLGTRS